MPRNLNWLLPFTIGEGPARKPLFEGCDRSSFKRTAYEPTVEKDRRGREGDTNGRVYRERKKIERKRRSKLDVGEAQRGRKDASLELSKQHGG